MLTIYAAFGGVVLVLLTTLFVMGTRRQRNQLLICVVIVSSVGIFFATRRGEHPDPEPPPLFGAAPVTETAEINLPSHNIDEGFVSSDACRECHAEQYSTWRDTYHRTMTQAATPESVVPSFDNVQLQSRGRTYSLTRKDDEFWVDTVSPAAEMAAFAQTGGNVDPASLPRVKQRIAMTTGSHYHQTYWMQNPNGTLIQFPWVYHISTQRWVYRIDSFLRPPSETVTFNIWNMTCIACHSTGGEPRVDAATHTMHSKGELGISCEACHGPGADHVADARAAQNSSGKLSVAVPHPGKLNAVESSKICGQCHVIAGRSDEAEFFAHGDPYTAGGDGFDSLRQVVDEMEDAEVNQPHFAKSIKTGFWPDGTVRTGGREYNGLIRSKCYTDGSADRQMSCVSCHSMHEYESPSKLMAKNKSGDRQCIQCHDQSQYTDQVASHTHHAADSEGSRCVNCHMPHTSYALFSAIRSHRVQSPAVRVGERGGRPNACNLCHLDQTKSWTANHLDEWYNIKTQPVIGDEAEIAAGALWAVTGDAAQRAVAAWHFGWDAAVTASGSDWTTPILADLLTDGYAAVRYMAWETLHARTGYSDLKYDFDGMEQHRASVRDTVLARWRQSSGVAESDSDSFRRRLLESANTRAEATVRRLLDAQDQRPISIVE